MSASLLFAVPLTLVYGSAIGFSAYYLCRAYPLASRSPGMIVPVFILAAACAAMLWSAAGIAWQDLWLMLAPGMIDLGIERRRLLMGMFGLGMLLYTVVAVLHYLVIEYASARRAERRELERALQARDAELRMLRTQIDPHFLFNSLNSISALTAFDPAGAREMTLRLADFFRHSLGLEAQGKVTLAQELALVSHFVAIEQVRFGTRLRFEPHCGVGADACLLPPMILQPLVENAVKHGIGGLPQGGCVRVTATRAGSILRVVVDNDVDLDVSPAPTRGQGVGLANVRARLATDYGHLASVHWRRTDTNFRVELTLPAQTGEKPCA
ncbi:sensor histidine kinase [Massilia sp. S19_KUP03_FR1]|uniref:sensor histidine kinase n=1 Tax=Massilia sp. S19_KUP03_FR1 TaxID=3025503 RepID=UPI002FCD92DF